MTLTIDRSVVSPNHNARPAGVKPSAIVLHTTEGKWPSDLQWLCNPQVDRKYQPVSCHYVISPRSHIHQIVPDDRRAWHAGTGSYLGITDWNNASLGIEISHKRGDPWPDGIWDVTAELCKMLIDKYAIRQSMVVAHRWIAPDRRSDPSDMSDVGLVAWIDDLYTVDWAKEWGRANYDVVKEWGIPARWRAEHTAGKPLGHALTDEMLLINGWVHQIFEYGLIRWRKPDITEVWR